jgi:hypothetical protein
MIGDRFAFCPNANSQFRARGVLPARLPLMFADDL